MKDVIRMTSDRLEGYREGDYLWEVGDVVGWPVASRKLLSHISAGDQAWDLLRHPQQPRRKVAAGRESLQIQNHVPVW